MPGKVKYHELTEESRKKYLGDFYSIVSTLKNREEVKNFFKDLLTLSETVMVSRRIQIAKMLLDGCTQEEVRKKLKVGFNNISQVEKWLNNGFGGYKKTIKAYKENESNKKYGKYKQGLLKKYPNHNFLVNLLEG